MSTPSVLRVLVLHNTDYASLPDDPAYASRADVANAAHGIAAALRRRGHHADVRGVDHPDLGHLLDDLARDRPDVVFNLCESLRGDSRHEIVVPSLLDLADVPYTGSGPFALGLALRKDRAKALLRDRGVPTPESTTIADGDVSACRLPFPLIVKPTREDASVGISSASVVHDRAALAAAVARVVGELRQPALVERYVDGREMYVSLLGNAPPEALPMHEIDFSHMPTGLPRIVSYSGKWDTSSAEYAGTLPVRCILDDDVRARVEAAARAAFEALGLTDYGRVDVRLAADHTPYVIDVNPNCDLSDGAGFSRAAGYGGLAYDALVERVCRIALVRHRHDHRNRTCAATPSVGEAAPDVGSLGARGADRPGRAVHAR